MSQKLNTPKGTRDFSSLELKKRNYLLKVLRDSFKSFNFQEIQTPSFENLSTLTDKYGDEEDSLMFKILSSGEKVKKADKLLKLTVDTGIDTRTVVSGIAEHYSPEEIIGQKVSILLNLAPRKIRGVESQGMILMAENENGELAFVSPTKEIETGNIIR